jgi:hypothetical protein
LKITVYDIMAQFLVILEINSRKYFKQPISDVPTKSWGVEQYGR